MPKKCTECQYFSLDSQCLHPHPSDWIFKDVRVPKIKHPELTWCANYIEKEREGENVKIKITRVERANVIEGEAFLITYTIDNSKREKAILIDNFEFACPKQDPEIYTKMFKKVRINSSIENIMSDITTRIKASIEFEMNHKEKTKNIKKILTSLIGKEIEV